MSSRSKSFWALVLCLCIMLAAGCAGKNDGIPETHSSGAERIIVAVSIVPQATFVEAVGGDLVDVVTMIPPGANPENYAPTPKAMEELSLASLYFAIGVPAEKNGILPRLSQVNSEMKVVDLPAEVDQVYPVREMAPGQADPHRWLSPQRAVEMVRIIAEELALADPLHAEQYKENAAAYQAQLNELDSQIKEALAGLSGRSFIVYHPCMGYFADDYGLKMIALEEEGKPAIAEDLQGVIDLARKENIKVVFYQAEMDSKQAETLARELKGEAVLIAPLASDYIENLKKTAQTFARSL